jgi:hypothetical protein
MASLKDLFTNPVSKIVNEKKVLETGYFENIDEVFELTKTNNRYQSTIDFSDPANFAKFGSAVKYYNDAINQINQTYPHNKSGLEKQTWENNLSDLEYYIYKNEYPRTTGYFYSSGSAYININNNVPTAETLKETFENNPKSVYGSNLYLDSTTGMTVEFWMNSESANSILLRLSSSTSELKLEAVSYQLKIGSTDLFYLDTNMRNAWNHFAFVISSSNVDTYINGTYSNSSTISSQIVGNILTGKLLESYKTKIDEFRIWNVARTPKQIGRFWKTHVNGNSATDKTLSVYYKFNEGIALNDSLNQFVEDYSGRDNYGNIVNYTSNCRSTDSGIDLSGLSSDLEEKDLILYSLDNSQALKDYLSEKLDLATEFDSTNYQRLYYTLPSWMIEEEQKDETKHMENFMQIISVYFDELLNKSSEISKYKNIKYTGDNEEIVPFYNKILSSTGFDVSDILSNADIVEKLLNKTDTNVLDEDITRVKNIIYQNIYNNLTYILKSKGTEKSVKNFLRAYGVNDNLVKLNVYGDNVEYKLTDTFNATSVNKKTIYLTGSQTIIQTDTPDVNDVKLLPALDLPFTFEVLSYFPSTQKQSDTTISLFGIKNLIGTETIKASFIKDSQDSKAGKFHLTSSVDNINLTSSTIYDVYDNSKWHLSVRLTNDTAYFYGVNTVADQAVNIFDLSASISSPFLDNSKEIYLGSDGIYPTDYKVASARYWNDILTNDELFYHSKDIENYGRTHFSQYSDLSGNNTHKDIERLLLNWTFDTVTGSNSSGEFFVEDEKWYYNDSPTSYLKDSRNFKYPGLGRYFPTSSNSFVDKTPLQTMKQSLPETLNSSDMINILSEDDAAFYGTGKKPERYYLAFENSMYQQISDEMLKFAASIVDFNNLIGEPKYKFTQEYQTLNELKQLFFKNIGNVPSLEKYINLYKWLDSSLGMMLEQLRPATARGTIGLKPVIENHVFSRNKIQHTLPYFKEKIIDLSANLKNTNENKGVHAQGLNKYEAKGIDVVSITNIEDRNYFNNYEVVQNTGDNTQAYQNKSYFQSIFTEQQKDTRLFDLSESLKKLDNSFSSSNGIDYNNNFIGYNIPGRDINFYFTGSDLSFIPSGTILQQRYDNNYFDLFKEPPVEWTLPSYSKVKVPTAVEAIEIYSPFNSIRDSFANTDLWNYLNNNKNGSVISGKEAIAYDDTVFLDYIRSIPNIQVSQSIIRDYIFPQKQYMGFDAIRNKPTYNLDHISSSATKIKTFWNDNIEKRIMNSQASMWYAETNSGSKSDKTIGDYINYYNKKTSVNFPLYFTDVGLDPNNCINTSITHSVENYSKWPTENSYSFIAEKYIYPTMYTTLTGVHISYGPSISGDLSTFSLYEAASTGLGDARYPKLSFAYNQPLPIYSGSTYYQLLINAGVVTDYATIESSSKKHNFNSYEEFRNDIKKYNNYSVIPEYIFDNIFNIYVSPNQLEELKQTPDDFLTINGINNNLYGNSNADLLYLNNSVDSSNSDTTTKKYLFNTKKLKFYNKQDNKISFKLNAIKKLNPYNGFYPQQRIPQIAKYFMNSYKVSASDDIYDFTDTSIIRALFSPGILLNSIKAGIGLDIPYISSSNTSSFSILSPVSGYAGSLTGEQVVSVPYTGKFDFEILLNPDSIYSTRLLEPAMENEFCSLKVSPYVTSDYKGGTANIRNKNLIKNNDKYKLVINNFLGEIPNFFLENQRLNSFTSKYGPFYVDPDVEYRMDLYFLQDPSFSQFSYRTYEQYLYGPATTFYDSVNKNVVNAYYEAVINPFSYLPFAPHYLFGSKQSITFKSNGVTVVDLDTIKNNISLTNITFDSKNAVFSDSPTDKYRIFNSTGSYTNSISYKSAMSPIEASLNYKLTFKEKTIKYDQQGIPLDYTENSDNKKWVIQSKMEYPLLKCSSSFIDIRTKSLDKININNTTDKIDLITNLVGITGLWNTYSEIPANGKSISLVLDDSSYQTSASIANKTGSLADLCGFQVGQKQIGKFVDTKTISEAVVIIPKIKTSDLNNALNQDKFKGNINNLPKVYIKDILKLEKLLKDLNITDEQKQNFDFHNPLTLSVYIETLKDPDKTKFTKQFKNIYSIDKNYSYIPLEEEKIANSIGGVQYKNFVDNRKTLKTILSNLTIKKNSIFNLVEKMTEYVLPQKFDWIQDKNIVPFNMYIVEIPHALDQQDLSDIWQGFMPKISTTPEEYSQTIEHDLNKDELMGLVSEYLETNKDVEIEFEIFKVKKRANGYYADLFEGAANDSLSNLGLTNDIKQYEKYTCNWPYDFFSLVELINIESNINSYNFEETIISDSPPQGTSGGPPPGLILPDAPIPKPIKPIEGKPLFPNVPPKPIVPRNSDIKPIIGPPTIAPITIKPRIKANRKFIKH